MAVKDNMNLTRNLHLLQYVPDTNMIIWHNIFQFFLSKYCFWILSLKADSKTKIAERNTKVISAFQTKIFCLRLKKIYILNGFEIPEEVECCLNDLGAWDKQNYWRLTKRIVPTCSHRWQNPVGERLSWCQTDEIDVDEHNIYDISNIRNMNVRREKTSEEFW